MSEDQSPQQPVQEEAPTMQVEAQTVPAKPARKPAFKRVETKPAEKAPSFKRVKPAEAKATTTPTESPIAAPNSPASPSVVVQAPIEVPFTKTVSTLDYEGIASLIAIRDYVNSLINGNFNTEKSRIHDLQKISLLLDRKIVDALLTPEFKSFVNFENAQSAVQAAARQNNIRSSLYG